MDIAMNTTAVTLDQTTKASVAERWALAGLSLSMLMPSLDTSIANVALPSLARSLGAPFAAIQWVVLAYFLAITTLIVGAGRLGDIVGRRRLLLAGIGLFTVASLLCGVAPSLWLLIAARAAQGLGAAVMMALTLAMVGEIVPKARTGSAMGLLGTMSAIGTSLGPSLGGVLIAGFGWRSIFLVNIPIGILNLVLAARTLPADRPAGPDRPRFDAVGTLLLALTLAAYALAMTEGGALRLGLLAAAAVSGMVFVLAQRQAAAPLLRLGMFRDASLSAGLINSVLVMTVMMATLIVGPFYLSRAFGLDPARVGLIMSVGPLVAALAGVPAGRLVDRFGARRLALAGLAGLAAGLLALAFAPGRLGVAGYLLAIAVVTASYALFQAANNTSIMTGIGPQERGVVSGMLSLSRNLGGITGAAVMGAVFAGVVGAADMATAEPSSVAAGMRATFVVAAVLIAIALVIHAGRRIPGASGGPIARG
jgi:EmrB/QacA subfamily drug resistance transporter